MYYVDRHLDGKVFKSSDNVFSVRNPVSGEYQEDPDPGVFLLLHHHLLHTNVTGWLVTGRGLTEGGKEAAVPVWRGVAGVLRVPGPRQP